MVHTRRGHEARTSGDSTDVSDRMTSSETATPAPHRTLRAIIADRLEERRAFAGIGGWLWSLYNRALLRMPGLPGRGAVRRVRLRNHDQPFYLRLGTSDWLVLQEIFIDGEYNTLIGLNLRDVKTVVDLGANIGLSVRLWQEKFPGAKVVAVEPDAGNMSVCKQNVGTGPSLFSCCVAGVRRKVSLENNPMGEWAFRMGEAKGAATIDALTLPDILEQAKSDGPIDLLKCDIEGAEEELFAHAAPWISRVQTMVVELHPPYGLDQFQAHLRAADTRPWVCQVINPGGDPMVVIARRSA